MPDVFFLKSNIHRSLHVERDLTSMGLCGITQYSCVIPLRKKVSFFIIFPDSLLRGPSLVYRDSRPRDITCQITRQINGKLRHLFGLQHPLHRGFG